MREKKILVALLCLCMMTALLPSVALAATATSVIVGGKTLNGTTNIYATTDSNGVVTLPSGYTESDPWNIKFQNGVLTLRNAKVAGVTQEYGESSFMCNYAIYATGTLRLVLVGTNSTVFTANSDKPSVGVRIDALGGANNGNLTIEGGGSLEAIAPATSAGNSEGIVVSGILIISGGSITAKGGNTTGAQGHSRGVRASTDFFMNGGTLTATGGDVTSSNSFSAGVNASTVTINGGTLIATGGSGVLNSFGVSAGTMNGIIMNTSVDGQVKVTAKTTDTTNDSYRRAFNFSPAISDGAYYTWSLTQNNTSPTPSTTTPYAWEDSQRFTELILGQAVATPTISPATGSYTSEQSVTLSCATAGATIRYTTDGNDPTDSSALYNGAITVPSTTTIKAKAFQSGMTPSAVVSATYTISNASALTVTPSGSTVFPIGGATGSAVFTVISSDGILNVNHNYGGATLDGQALDLGSVGAPGADGSVADGSLVATIHQAKLNTLSVGKHTLAITLGGTFAGRTVMGVITVTPTPVMPSTGDGTPLIGLALLMLLSCGGVVILLARKRLAKR